MCCTFGLCCGFNLRFGSSLMVLLYFLSSMVVLILKIFSNEYDDNVTTGNVAVLVCTIFGFFGVFEKRGIFLIPFLICHIIVSIIIIICLFAAFIIKAKESDHLFWPYFLIGVLTAFFWYSACGIYSYYTQLELKKREQEAGARQTIPPIQTIPFIQTNP